MFKTQYSIPLLYIITHLATGYIGYYKPIFIILFLIYQLYQYTLDIRFFLLSNYKTSKPYKKGNNVRHTMRKIGEAVIGYVIAYVINVYANQ